ncbi:MAG TPA: polyprenol phosphomannose-dependent alpha 1,6 mannosyltransferase MptB [Kineosporiaceae bacterium]|nr:polyprenol phosphomannose-dependent alpha 1,6 mannosyltransferase MptB [Kineosporiaceae bacterium]
MITAKLGRIFVPDRGWVRAATGVLAVLLVAAVAFGGDSAAVPGLGAATWYPPWDAGLGLGSALVTVLLVIACLLGSVTVGLGLLAVRRGVYPSPRTVVIAALGAVIVLTAVPPLGSADHLSYAAYGRIAAAGDDPYLVDPLQWRDGTDPVAGAIQPPWQHTQSVYGPVATAAQAVVAWLGHGSLRATIWFWQLLSGLAFLAAGFALDRLTRHDARARGRAAVLWTLNPLLLNQLVLGGHLDVIAVAGVVGAIALAARRPLLAGMLLGVAVGSKITFALFGLAILWGLRDCARPVLLRRVGFGLLGALLVLVPAHLWSGPHTYRQLHQASRMVSLATPWRPLVNQLDPIFGGTVRTVVGPLALVCGLLLAILLFRRLRAIQTGVGADPDGGTVTAAAARAAVLLSVAWLLTTPYALPWYDAMVWGPLALLSGATAVGAAGLDVAMLARLTVLTLAYIPGRVVGMSADVERFTLGFRRETAPWLMLAILVAVVVWAVRRPTSDVRRSAAPMPGRSLR